MTAPWLEANHLSHRFPLPGGRSLLAVDDVSFRLHQGETLALVGESGSGKTTLGRMVVGLTAPQSGSLSFAGSAIRAPRREVQMVFQDNAAALNPRHGIGASVMAPLLWTGGLRRAAAEAQARALLDRVGLPAEHFFTRLPHELSGGQRQRVGIARALAPNPSVLVADEPVSALDVSVRAQILLLFRELRDERGLASLFITHDLGVVRSVAQLVLVLYREDHRFLLDPIIPRLGATAANYDLVIASQPYRARASTEFKSRRVIAPLVRALGPGGRLIGIHSYGHDPAMEIVHKVWPNDEPFITNRHDLLKAVKTELGAAGRDLNFNAN